MRSRTLCKRCALLLLLWPSLGSAQAIGEADVIRIVAARDPETRVATELVRAGAAAEAEAGLYPNPSLAFSREHLPSDVRPELHDDFVLTVPIVLSGRRDALIELARAETAAAKSYRAQRQNNAVLRALSSFYRAIAERARVAVQRTAAERLNEAVRVLALRFEQGTASGYDRMRIELEAELAQSALREAESHARASAEELARLLDVPAASLTLRGELTLMPLAVAGRDERDSIVAARAAIAASERAGDAAQSAWVPPLALSGGLRVDHGAAPTELGYIAGLSIELPLFSRGQELKTRAQAQGRIARAQLAALGTANELDALRARTEHALAQSELTSFEAATSARLVQLERAAESGYREGQRSILELLDVQRTSTSIALRRLDLALSGKLAEVALRAAMGEFE